MGGLQRDDYDFRGSRMAFDLHNPVCRENFISYLKWNKFKWHWWKLVISDTWKNVCPFYKA